MITLVTLICSIATGNCIVNTPHKYPYFMPTFKDATECRFEGKKAKAGLYKYYTDKGEPAIITFRCVKWGSAT